MYAQDIGYNDYISQDCSKGSIVFVSDFDWRSDGGGKLKLGNFDIFR